MLIIRFLLIASLLALLSGCATTRIPSDVAKQVPLNKATQEMPEEELLDVWIELFDPGTLHESDNDVLGLSTEIREAEARFIPAHLRRIMEKTGYWGAVRVVPHNTEGSEILVRGTIISSDGETLELDISASDATGRQWFNRSYRGEADINRYGSDDKDSFETVYHAIANDLALFRQALAQTEISTIRQVAELRFAADMLPDAFSGHVSRDDKGNFTLQRLPARDDPSFERVLIIRERDFLLIDTLNGYYENFHSELEIPYQEWRKARTIEAGALREVKRKANKRKALGVLAILGAIALEATGSNSSRAATGTARDVMMVGGMYAIKSGIDINAQSVIHQGAIEELGESFASEAKPLVVEVEGEILELKGSAEEQYQQWRGLMRKIYASETGLGSDPVIITEQEPGLDPNRSVD